MGEKANDGRTHQPFARLLAWLRTHVMLLAMLLLASVSIYKYLDYRWSREHKMGRYPLEALRTLMSRGVAINNVLDVGAHQGSWSSELKEFLLHDASFFLIEGNKGWEQTLRGCGFPFRIALVGDVEKDVTFYKLCETGGCSGGNSVFREASQWGSGYKEVKEHMLTIDQVAKQEGLVNIDMIKMDIQGAELMALKGASETLKNVKAIFLELSTVPLYPEAPLLVEMIVFLESIGFKLFNVADIMNRDGMTISIDGLFVRSDLHEVWDDPPWKRGT